MEPHHDFRTVLFFKFPKLLLEVAVGLDTPIGIQEVKQVLDACVWVHHINHRNTLCPTVDAAPDALVMPLVKRPKLRGIRSLCID